MSKKSSLSNKDEELNKDKDEQIIGISVISSIVSKVISDPSQILSGLKQILFFYRLLPKEWKKRAFWIFETLWNKKKVIMSTDPEQPGKIYEVTFEDTKLEKLYKILPQVDQAIILQGKSMLELINKGLHGDSDEIKRDVEKRYGQRGLNIVNMLTTNDIQYLLEELKEPLNDKDCEEKFNEWAYKYDTITFLVSPINLSNPNEIKKRVKELSKNTPKDYVLINLSGKTQDCTELWELISKLKDNKELNYYDIDSDISDSGFCKSLRIRINFKKKK
ncbi:MAG: hypothetical protein U9P44_00295 [archaeon]|nr:hypothetical protein [archaeon]